MLIGVLQFSQIHRLLARAARFATRGPEVCDFHGFEVFEIGPRGFRGPEFFSRFEKTPIVL